MGKRTAEPKRNQESLLDQSKAAETRRKLDQQKADLDQATGSHQMTMAEQEREYKEGRAMQEAEELGIPHGRIEAAQKAGIPVSMLVEAFKLNGGAGEPLEPGPNGRVPLDIVPQGTEEGAPDVERPPSQAERHQVSEITKRPTEPQLPERLFSGPEADISGEAGIISAIAREEGELKAAIVLARQFRRNEADAEGAIRRACNRPTFAQMALYSFPRGGTTIKGPSVKLAREIARCWGNLRHGVRVVSEDAERVHLKGYCFDLQTNAYVEHENKFAKLIQRKVGSGADRKTVWVKPDERDLRELIGRQGAILQRNAILQSIPADLVELAMELVGQTQLKGAKADPVGEKQNLLASFAALGVHEEHIAEKYRHSVQALTAEELVELRQIYLSIRDGQSTLAEHFFVVAENGPAGNGGSRTEALAGKLNGQQ